MRATAARTAIVAIAGVAVSTVLAIGPANAAHVRPTPTPTPTSSSVPATSTPTPTTPTPTSSTVVGSRVYLGRVQDNGDHNYYLTLTQGTYAIEYDASYGAVLNTYVDVTRPHWIPLEDGRYLGQTSARYGTPALTPTFDLTSGSHKLTSQAVVVQYGYVDVYLVRK